MNTATETPRALALISVSDKTGIVEFAKEQREIEGLSIFEAAVKAARLRLRAVLMTAFSFVLGVIPLLIATGAGAGSRRSLGTAVFSGMVVASILVPLFVPVFYTVIQRIREKVKGVNFDKPQVQDHGNPGYDILSRDPDTDMLYFIEVKGHLQQTTDIHVSAAQVNKAKANPERWRLAVVSVPDDDEEEPRVSYLVDPFEDRHNHNVHDADQDNSHQHDFDKQGHQIDHIGNL